jgi:hypothetical protein
MLQYCSLPHVGNVRRFVDFLDVRHEQIEESGRDVRPLDQHAVRRLVH